MKAYMFLAALAVVAVLAAPAAAQGGQAAVSTRNLRYKGYTFSTDVSELFRLDSDACAIATAIGQGRPQVARDIFYNGSSVRGMSYAALIRSETNRNGPLWNLTFNDFGYASPAAIISFVDNAIGSGRPLTALQALSQTAKAKIFYDFLGQAISGVRNNPNTQRNLDSAFAIYAGAPGATCPTAVYDIINVFTSVWGNGYRGVANQNLYLSWILGDAQFASNDRVSSTNFSANAAIITSSAMEASAIYAESTQQLILYNAISIDLGNACNNSQIVTAARTQHTQWMPILRAFARGMGASNATIANLDNVTSSGAGFTETYAALGAVLSSTGGNVRNLLSGRPNIDNLKLTWFRNQGFDVRNCTAPVLAA